MSNREKAVWLVILVLCIALTVYWQDLEGIALFIGLLFLRVVGLGLRRWVFRHW